jgi:hypothetical protein
VLVAAKLPQAANKRLQAAIPEMKYIHLDLMESS